jgi:hypothetical protein
LDRQKDKEIDNILINEVKKLKVRDISTSSENTGKPL